MPKKYKCVICGAPTSRNNSICSSKRHYYKCVDCGKLVEVKYIKDLRNRNNLFKTNIISDDESKCIFEIDCLRCPECFEKFKGTNTYKLEKQHIKELTFAKNHDGKTAAEYGVGICPECGGRSGKHRKGCSRYIQDGSFCNECGGHNNMHYKSCSHYKVYKDGHKICPECGATRGHKKTCSHYNVKPCDECGSIHGHYSWCSHDKKCKYCGYSLRSRTHDPSCPLYDDIKSIHREETYQRTMFEKYGVMNSYFLPGVANKLIESANESENTIHISKVNRNIAKHLKDAGVEHVELEYKIGSHRYDIYCENNGKKLVIERNPSVSHNFDYDYMYATEKLQYNRGGKSKRYHLDLSIDVENHGLELIHWFDNADEDKMYEFILSKLGMNVNVLYGRKCDIRFVDRTAAFNFINDNHLLRITRKPDISIGLFYNNDLVSVMSFNKLKDNKTNRLMCGGSVFDCYELIRYCNSSRTTVVGGANKLHKYFINNNNVRFIKTISDYNLGNGTIYKNIGYIQIGNPKPSCIWINRKHKFVNNNLVLRGTDKFLGKIVEDYFYVGMDEDDFISRGGLEVYGKFPSNEDIMMHYGFFRIYDSGYKTWIFNNTDEYNTSNKTIDENALQ